MATNTRKEISKVRITLQVISVAKRLAE